MRTVDKLIRKQTVTKLWRHARALNVEWQTVRGTGRIDEAELAYADQNWALHSEHEWRGYVYSISTRSK